MCATSVPPASPSNFRLYPESSHLLDSVSRLLLCSLASPPCPKHTPAPCPPLFLFIPPSVLPSSRSPQAAALLQSHPAFWDKENTEDQFCSVTFGGGLQSKGMPGEVELKEIYWGCLGGKEEISTLEKRRETKGWVKKSSAWNRDRTLLLLCSDCMLGQMRVDKRERMVMRGARWS